MQKALKIYVIGKVQNVGFRYYTKKKALELNIGGFVKNKINGSVYIEAVGEEAAINEFIIWCYSGPKWARVQDVKVESISLFDDKNFIVK